MDKIKIGKRREIIEIEGFQDIYDKIVNNRIFKLWYSDKKFSIEENCDEWFSLDLSKEDCLKISDMFKFLSENIDFKEED